MANHPHPYLASNLAADMPNMTQQHFSAAAAAPTDQTNGMANNISAMHGVNAQPHSYHQQPGPPPMNDLNLGTTNTGYAPSAATAAAAAAAAQYNSGVPAQPHPMYQIPPTMPLSIQVNIQDVHPKHSRKRMGFDSIYWDELADRTANV